MERSALLKRVSAELGSTWAAAMCDNTRREGRVVAGGWPGTLLEARGRVWQRLNAELARYRLQGLSEAELTQATDETYARARQDWTEDARRSQLELNAPRNR